jgi:hypothetical protein
MSSASVVERGCARRPPTLTVALLLALGLGSCSDDKGSKASDGGPSEAGPAQADAPGSDVGAVEAGATLDGPALDWHADGASDAADGATHQSMDAGIDGLPPVSCPADPAMVEPCATPGTTCTVQGACCLCELQPACGAYPEWSCARPSQAQACGTSPPALGATCTSPDLACTYCAGQTPVARACVRGNWANTSLRICR